MNNYNLLINKKQDINLDEIDIILKKISKQYREYLYMNNEYMESINEDGYYVFLTSSYEFELDDCNNSLRNAGISTIIATDNELYSSEEDEEDDENDEDNNSRDMHLVKYESFIDVFRNEILTQNIENLLVPFLENENSDILVLDDISKKIIFLFSNSGEDYENELILSYLIFIFHSNDLSDIAKEYVLYMLIKCLWSKDKKYFKKKNDHYIFVSECKLEWESKINLLKKYNKQKYNGFWRISFCVEESDICLFLHDSSKKNYNDDLINYLSDEIEKIKIPSSWDWINFQDFIYFRNFDIESDSNMTEFKDYYKILGVNLNADLNTIKTSYRNKINEYHPDISKNTNAREQSILLNEAYQILSNETKRAQYDKKYRKINFI